MDGNATGIDFEAVFQSLPGAVLLLNPELVIVDANRVFERVSQRSREEMRGLPLLTAFPDNPGDPDASGTRNLRASLERVLATGTADSMALQRYDVELPGRPGVFEERYWSVVNSPVLAPDGGVALIVHRTEEVTGLVHARRDASRSGDPEHRQLMEADLYTRAAEIQADNELLREAHAQERKVALALQEAMLPAPRPTGGCGTAVRYRPAVGALNVCGDWYDLVELPDDRIAVAVGDVVGHGLAAAGVMGQLRSALSAVSRVAGGPAAALEVLELYARSVAGAESSTVVDVHIDCAARILTYSSAGHPPPALLAPDGTVTFLDRATDPPLGARPEHRRGPEAALPFGPGHLLALYTDGLIERRREDIDAGLARLAESLRRNRAAGPEELADALLNDLLPAEGATDDVALVVVRL